MRRLALSLAMALSVATSTAARAETPGIVTDIAPVASLVAMVAGTTASVDMLVAPGSSAHGLTLKPSQARALRDAALVVWIGPALSPGLDRQIPTLAPEARSLALADVPGTLHLPFREGGLLEATGHEHEHDHDHDDHGEEPPFDPHLWLAPENATLWLSAIAEALAALDPENATTYRANATAGALSIATAEASAQALLNPLRDTPLGVSHDAFQYVEHSFGLTVIGALTDGDDAAPGAARVASLHELFAATPPACILNEPGADPDLIATITPPNTPQTDIDVLGSAMPQGAALYPALLTDIASRIATCATQ